MIGSLRALVLAAATAILWACGGPDAADRAAAADTEIRILDGLALTYLATPALFDRIGVRPGRDYGVAANGNIILNSPDGAVELEVSDRTLAFERIAGATSMSSIALDEGATVLGLQDRYFGQVGTERFQAAFPLPEGELRLATSIRPGWVYLLRNESRRRGQLYGIWDNGTLSALAQFPSRIRAVADDADHIYVATDRALLAFDAQDVRVIAEVSPDLGPIDSLAARSGRLFLVSGDRTYLLRDGVLLMIARGASPQLLLVDDRLYGWDSDRRLLFYVDVAPLLTG